MTGPAHLLEIVAPDRGGRKHARNRIDHAPDGSDLEPFGTVVRRLIQEAAAVALDGGHRPQHRRQRLELSGTAT